MLSLEQGLNPPVSLLPTLPYLVHQGDERIHIHLALDLGRVPRGELGAFAGRGHRGRWGRSASRGALGHSCVRVFAQWGLLMLMLLMLLMMCFFMLCWCMYMYHRLPARFSTQP